MKISFFKTLNFKISDLLFLIGIALGLIICIEGTRLMGVQNPKELANPLWFYLCCFIFLLIVVSVYFFFVVKKEHIKISPVILFSFTILAISGFESILFSPLSTTILILKNGESVQSVNTVFSLDVKIIFFLNYFCILLVIFIGLFVFPKRVKSLKFLQFISFCVYLFGIFLLIYSLFTETNKIVFFFNNVFTGSIQWWRIDEFSLTSIFGHRNLYGMYLEFLIACALISYSINKRKYNLFVLLIAYVNLLLTFCKSGIVITTFFLLVFIVVSLVKGLKQKSKKTITITTSILVVSLCSATLILLLVPSFKNLFTEFFRGGDTLKSRITIWKNSLTIVNHFSVIRGAGYGCYNSILFSANCQLYNDSTYSSHSWFFSLLGRGGIIAVFAFISLIVYFLFTIYKLFKHNKNISITLLLSVFLFFAHSFVEDCYYPVIVLISLSLIAEKHFENNNIQTEEKH